MVAAKNLQHFQKEEDLQPKSLNNNSESGLGADLQLF